MKSSSEMHEGVSALNRFRKAMKTIVSVPKTAVTADRKNAPVKKKKTK